jgi:hypothetical protein
MCPKAGGSTPPGVAPNWYKPSENQSKTVGPGRYGAGMTNRNTWPRDRHNAPGGGRHSGPCANPYRSNQPPRHILLDYLRRHGGYARAVALLERYP